LFKDAVSSSYYAMLNISVTVDNVNHSLVVFAPKRDAHFTQRISCSVGIDVVGKTELYFAPEDRQTSGR